jgi:hypothetical protein
MQSKDRFYTWLAIYVSVSLAAYATLFAAFAHG